MESRSPRVNVDILLLREETVLLGLLGDQWTNGERQYGVPGKDLLFGETIGAAVERNIREEFGCDTLQHAVIAVNANTEYGNHYVGIGVTATIAGDITHRNTDDWQSWEWFALNALPDNLFAPARHLLECYRTGRVCLAE